MSFWLSKGTPAFIEPYIATLIVFVIGSALSNLKSFKSKSFTETLNNVDNLLISKAFGSRDPFSQ